MTNIPAPPEQDDHSPSPNAETSNVTQPQVSTLYKIFDSSRNFVALAITEWLPSLIDQPTNPPFVNDPSFSNEFPRVTRLLVMVVLLSTIIISGLTLVFTDMSKNAATISTIIIKVIRISLSIIAAVFLIALMYHPIAYICGVKISNGQNLSVRQVFFTTLYIIVPWLPIFAFVWIAIIPIKGTLLLLLLLSPYLCFVYIIYNFAKAIKVITDSQWLRIWVSVITPFFLFVLVVSLMLLSSMS